MKTKNKKGSALILTIAVTTLLALLGALFLLLARMDEQSTSSLESYKALDAGVDAVIAKLATELKLDTPGIIDSNGNTPEYYDYPGDRDRWLANLEPIDDGAGNYIWQQITDLFDDFTSDSARQDIEVRIIGENDEITDADNDGVPDNQASTDTFADADADGDGVADSKWVELKDISSQTGQKLYAAIRVIDNSAMLNVNTGYMFDANSTQRDEIDGTRQTQINLAALSQRGVNGTLEQAADDLFNTRVDVNSAPATLDSYFDDVVWGMGTVTSPYTPFDISDELILRYRYFLNNEDITTRADDLWYKCFKWGIPTPLETGDDITNADNWFYRVNNSSTTNIDLYDYRHIATTYNIDRYINPFGGKSLVLNGSYTTDPNIDDIYDHLITYFDDKVADGNMIPADRNYYLTLHAQLLANLKDFDDYDDFRGYQEDVPQVTVIEDWQNTEHYGFERPYVFISELVRAFQWDNPADTNDPNTMHRSYGIEIYKRPRTEIFNELTDNEFQLRIINPDYEITVESQNFVDRGGRFYVRIFDDKDANGISLEDLVEYNDSPWNGATGVDPNVTLSWDPYRLADLTWKYDFYIGEDYNDVKDANSSVVPPGVFHSQLDYGDNSYAPVPPFDTDTTYYWRVDDVNSGGEAVRQGNVWEFTTWDTEPNNLETNRTLGDPAVFTENSELVLERKVASTGQWLIVDRIDCADINSPFFDDGYEGIYSYRRNLSWRKVLKRIWQVGALNEHSLGNYGWHFFTDNSSPIPLNGHDGFVNVGELGFVYDVDIYDWENSGPYNTDDDVLVDLTDPNVHILFNYLTRIHNNDSLYRVKGRVNINTAPYFVIKQLPWVSQRESGATLTEPDALAKAIIAYRDKLDISAAPLNGPDYEDTTAVSNNGRENGTGLDYLREELGFESIGELTTVMNDTGDDEYDIRYYILGSEKNDDQFGFPDIHYDERTGADGMTDDLEERNLIFSRISDLVTVRSDVFTAYILVRLGTDGPQRRVIAILDRSGVNSASSKVKVKTVYPVPDPR